MREPPRFCTHFHHIYAVMTSDTLEATRHHHQHRTYMVYVCDVARRLSLVLDRVHVRESGAPIMSRFRHQRCRCECKQTDLFLNPSNQAYERDNNLFLGGWWMVRTWWASRARIESAVRGLASAGFFCLHRIEIITRTIRIHLVW